MIRRLIHTACLSLSLVLLAAAPASAWTTSLEVDEFGASGVALLAADDGSAAMLNRAVQQTPTGNQAIVNFRTYDGADWTAPVRVDQGLPTYNGKTAQVMFEPVLAAPEGGSLPGVELIAGINGRYSRSILGPEGVQYAFFVATFDGASWSPWVRVTPVGRVFDVVMDVDDEGTLWIAYRTSGNLDPGDVLLSSWDLKTGTAGPTWVIDAASQALTFRSTDVTVGPDGTWVTYRAPDGLYGRLLRENGNLGSRKTIVEATYAPPHNAAMADGTLWVVTDELVINLYRLQGNQFVLEAADLFPGFYEETDTYIEAIDYVHPELTARPGGGVVVGTARYHHFEDFLNSANDFDDHSVAVRDLTDDGVWSDEETAYADGAWNNAGGVLTSSKNQVWTAGSVHISRLFAAVR